MKRTVYFVFVKQLIWKKKNILLRTTNQVNHLIRHGIVPYSIECYETVLNSCITMLRLLFGASYSGRGQK